MSATRIQAPAPRPETTSDPSLVESVRVRIGQLLDSGAFPPGSRLPPERELAERFEVNRLTVNKAIARYVDAGRLHRRVGSGTWVQEPSRSAALEVIDVHLPANDRMDEGASAILGRPGVVEGVHDYFRNRPVRVAVSFFRDPSELAARLAQAAAHPGSAQLLWYRPDPILRDATRAILALGRPLCLIDDGDPDLPAPVVASDNFQGGLIAAETLTQAGRRRLAYLTMPPTQESLRERLAGFRNGAARGGATVVTAEIDAGAAVPSAVDRLDGVDAIAASNDWIALEALACLKRRNRSVPHDVALIGYDDIEPGRYCSPALTTVAQDFYGIGFRAADIIDRAWGRPDAGGRVQLLGPKLIRRASL